ncbi:MAG: hypothetical protein WAM30_12600 [Candidatus Dormiibacterota bacterium]
MPADAATAAAFDDLLDRALAAPSGGSIDYPLAAPKWQFLCHVADRRGFVLHGSGRPDIARFEPRKADDVNEFGNQAAVYAAADGIWPIYFAVLDRDRFGIGIHLNSCVRVPGEPDPYYFFSVTRTALEREPWRSGTVYLLPRCGFEAEAAIETPGRTVQSAQMRSANVVTPVARLTVEPRDFPFLHRVRGHDDAVTIARARADPSGFPWVDAEP